MEPPDETRSPPPAPPAPTRTAAGAVTPFPGGAPTPEQLLRLIDAAGGPWFPSAHAADAGVPRDSLDAPLDELRQAGLVRVASWVKGAGQGYVPTPDAAAITGAKRPDPAPEPPPADPKAETASAELDGVSGVVDVRAPVVTPALILANVVWFGIGLVAARRLGVPTANYLSGWSGGVLERLGAVSAPDLLRGEWWRLASCCFVHAGVWHLLMNLFSLGVVGSLAELLWGRWRLLAVYAAGGLAGSCLAMAHRPVTAETGVVSILAGASGAIWGVSTSLVAWLVLFRADLPRDLVTDWTRRLALAFALNAAVSFLPGVSWEAHFGGGVAGFVAAGLLNAIRFGDHRRRLAATILLAALPVASVGGLVVAMHTTDDWADVKRRAAADRTAADHRASARDIRPSLEPISPGAVRPVEWSAVGVWLIRPDRRPAAVAAAKSAVEALKAEAVTLANRTSVPPGASTSAHWAHAKAYAEAQAASLELLRRMLDGTEVPDVAAWKAWGESRGEAARRWDALTMP